MNDKLIDKLSNLELEEKSIKRGLDRYYMDLNARTRMFNRLQELKKEKEQVKFKLRLEKELKNEKSRKSI